MCDYIVNDDVRYLPLLDDVYSPDEPMSLPRYNDDTELNDHGKKLIEMCKMCGLRIVNGRIGELSNSSSKTFVGAMGSSTVDLVLCSPNLFPMFKQFQISPITEFSDHKYIEFAINAHIDVPRSKPIPETYKMSWKDILKCKILSKILRKSLAPQNF